MYETYNSSYADLNGDGIMEILQFGGSEEGDGLQVKALQAGKPVDVPLGYQYHW
jgi:hypothetical protein